MKFAGHLKRLRESRGMTRYRLAQLSGISRPGVSMLEEDGSDPKLSTLGKLAKALDVEPWELLPGQEGQPTKVDRPGKLAGEARKKRRSSKAQDGVDLRSYLNDTMGTNQGTLDAIKSLPGAAWELFNKHNPRTIKQLIESCESLAVFLESVL
jgi:transcriptional regulator with XRE-family HTH domain